jgi:hypothetical protein
MAIASTRHATAATAEACMLQVSMGECMVVGGSWVLTAKTEGCNNVVNVALCVSSAAQAGKGAITSCKGSCK